MQSDFEKPTLFTSWGERITEHHIVHQYPRPQLERTQWLNLNGVWSYCISSKEDFSPLTTFMEDGQILVPFALESALSGVSRVLQPSETLWYKRQFELNTLTDITVLHFGAVDWEITVWLNGIKLGEHKGGYCPFSFEIQQALNSGENELIIAVQDNTDKGLQERGKQSLHPKGLFYTSVSGIWQTVWLEQLHVSSIKSINIDTTIQTKQVIISGHLFNASQINITIQVYDGSACIQQKQLAIDGCSFETTLILPSMKCWHPKTPHLYDVVITVTDKSDLKLDELKSYFAMREITINKQDGHPLINLNGQPIFQLGVLDQGYWPDGLYTAPSDEALIDDIMKMKELGFNMLRKHIKVESARFYYHCDRLGMLVWQDMINGGKPWNVVQEAVLPNIFPNWFRKDNTTRSYRRTGRTDKQNREQYIAELTEMINHLKHFPSIVVWCPFNEGWGQFDAKEVVDYILTLDSTRLIDHASGWFDQGAGHMRSVHTYFKPLTKPKHTNGRVPVLSEFGGYNLKVEGHTEQGHKEVGYKKCNSQDELQHLYNILMQQLARQIELGLAASVYTQLSDVEGEVNGIMTYDRKVVKLNKEVTLKKHQELLQQFDQKWHVDLSSNIIP